jgi:hypothetical protein
MEIVVLRLLHIVAGAFWVGAVVTSVFFVEPTATASGREGDRFLAQFAIRRHFVAVLTVAALVSAAAGALLYWIDSGGLRAEWITTNTGLGFTLGALAGLAALAIPPLFLRAEIARLGVVDRGGGREGDGGSEPEASAEGQAHFRRWSLIQAALLLVAIAFMSTARYLP